MSQVPTLAQLEARSNAMLAALEAQRNNANNQIVELSAALTLANTRIKELEGHLAALAPLPDETNVDPPQHEADL